jgi:hypothetical protein
MGKSRKFNHLCLELLLGSAAVWGRFGSPSRAIESGARTPHSKELLSSVAYDRFVGY